MVTFLTIVITVAMAFIVFRVLRVIFSVFGLFGKWLDNKFPPVSWNSSSGYKPTYPIEHEPPTFNQNYSKERTTNKPTPKYQKPVFSKSETEYLKSINQYPTQRNSYCPENAQPKKSKVPSILLHITYFDMDWNLTERDIQVFKYKSHYEHGVINACCLLRGEERTFKIPNIQQCIDLQTGELIADIQKFICDFYEKPYKPLNPSERSKELALLVEFRNPQGNYEKKRLSVGQRFNQDDGLLKAWWIDNPDDNDRQQTVIQLNDIAKITNLKTGQVITNKEQFMRDFLALKSDTEQNEKLIQPKKEASITKNTVKNRGTNSKNNPLILHLEYINADNEFTERDIRITSSKRNRAYSDYFTAYCFLRKGERQFKISGIRKCVNTETGEIIDIRNFLEHYYDKKLEIMPLGFFK